ncbi:hypothetical protein L195_g044277, partial [Trifolium pratense]
GLEQQSQSPVDHSTRGLDRGGGAYTDVALLALTGKPVAAADGG